MKRVLTWILVGAAAAAWGAGCASRLDRTHRGDLLDAEVDAQRVEAALKSSGPDYGSIHVEATNDVVVLGGTVKSKEIRSKAEEIAKGVDRKVDLKNELQVAGDGVSQ